MQEKQPPHDMLRPTVMRHESLCPIGRQPAQTAD